MIGSVSGAAAGAIVVPGYHFVGSGIKATWHGGVEGVMVSVVCWGWNLLHLHWLFRNRRSLALMINGLFIVSEV